MSRPVDPDQAWAAIQQSERRHLLAPTLLLLTFATGVIDAVSYLAIGSVFTANMTGNLVLVGFAIGGAPGFSLPRTVVSVLAFSAGAAAAGRLARRWYRRPFIWMQRITRLELVFLLAATALATGLSTGVTTPDSPLRFLVVTVLGMAMGLRNASVRRLGFVDIPTTVATSTLSDLASESRAGGGERRNQAHRAIALLCMLAGAAAGAAMVREASPTAGFALAIGTVLLAIAHQQWTAVRHPRPAGVIDDADEPSAPRG